MIQLTPSVGIQRETSIDYNVLSSVITLVLEKNFNRPLNYRIKINKSRDQNTSNVIINCNQHYQRNFVINLARYESIKQYISTIIHEIRHVIQHTIFRHNIVGAFRTTRDYYNSIEDKQFAKQPAFWLSAKKYLDEQPKKKDTTLADPYVNRLKMFKEAIEQKEASNFIRGYAQRHFGDVERAIGEGQFTKEQAIEFLDFRE